ncbi:MAG: PrsW family glutamic-type intramembrane protease [Anaerolineae bacterium]
MLIAYAITIIAPIVILFVLYSLDTFGIQPRRYVIRALIWGGVAFVLSLAIETGVAAFIDRTAIMLLVAPAVEEILKALPLRWLMVRGNLVNAVDGLSFGFEIGLSFGMVENLFYLLTFAGTSTEAVGFAAARVLTSGLMHAVAMGMVGAVAGHASRYAPRRQRLYFYSAVSLAVFFHVAFNIVVVRLDGAWLMLVALAIGLAGFAVMIVLIRREVRWVQNQVMVIGGDSPAAARMAASDPAALAGALDKYKSALGQEMVSKIERYSALVAQQMLLRSAMDNLGNNRHRAAVEARLRHVDGQLAVLNADIGLFMRVWMSMLVAKDEELRSALAIAEVSTAGDPLLNLALQLAGRTIFLSEEEVTRRKNVLINSHLFGALTGSDLEDVALMLDRRPCAAGELILRRDQPNDAMYIVASGQFRMRIQRADGQFAQMGEVYPGEVFGLASVLGDREVTTDVVCFEAGMVYSVGRAGLMSLIYGNPRIALVLLSHLAMRIQEWGDLIQQLAQPQPLTVPARYRL